MCNLDFSAKRKKAMCTLPLFGRYEPPGPDPLLTAEPSAVKKKIHHISSI